MYSDYEFMKDTPSFRCSLTQYVPQTNFTGWPNEENLGHRNSPAWKMLILLNCKCKLVRLDAITDNLLHGEVIC